MASLHLPVYRSLQRPALRALFIRSNPSRTFDVGHDFMPSVKRSSARHAAELAAVKLICRVLPLLHCTSLRYCQATLIYSMPRDKGKSRARSASSSSSSEEERYKSSRHDRSGKRKSSAKAEGSGQLVLHDSRRERESYSGSRYDRQRQAASPREERRTSGKVDKESSSESPSANASTADTLSRGFSNALGAVPLFKRGFPVESSTQRTRQIRCVAHTVRCAWIVGGS